MYTYNRFVLSPGKNILILNQLKKQNVQYVKGHTSFNILPSPEILKESIWLCSSKIDNLFGNFRTLKIRFIILQETITVCSISKIIVHQHFFDIIPYQLSFIFYIQSLVAYILNIFSNILLNIIKLEMFSIENKM